MGLHAFPWRYVSGTEDNGSPHRTDVLDRLHKSGSSTCRDRGTRLIARARNSETKTMVFMRPAAVTGSGTTRVFA